MMRGFVMLLVLSLAGSMRSRAEESEHPPEPIGAQTLEHDDVTRHTAVLPGRVIDWGLLERESGSRAVALLTEIDGSDEREGDPPRQVWIWDPEGPSGLDRLGPELSHEAHALVTSRPPGAAASTVQVVMGSELVELGTDDRWKPILSLPAEMFPVRDIAGRSAAPGPEIVLQTVGRLVAYGRAAPSGAMKATWQVDLPVQVERRWGGLRLETPPVASLEGPGSGAQRFVVGPEAHGLERMRTWLIGTGTSEPADPIEVWNRFSGPEEVQESWYVSFNDAPALIVTTILADKRGVFERKKLRVFRLSADRTRAGSAPILETLTRTRHWYSTCAGVADVNGDGKHDVVSAQPKGLGAGSLWVEGHLSLAEGGFDSKARGSELPFEEVEHCGLESDLNGDGRIDLWIRAGHSILVFPTLAMAEAREVVSERPRWRTDLDGIVGRPRPVELFLGEPTQLIVTGHTKGGRSAAHVLRFR